MIINIIVALIVFGIIVLVHEFGHYIVAVKNGVLVEEFAIGMGPKIFSKKKGDTVYSVRILPLGGFCQMLGENEEDDDERSFSSKSVLARMSIIFAGPFMNFLLAFIILLIFSANYGYLTTTVDQVEKDYPAYEAGLRPGDKIISTNGSSTHVFKDIQFYISDNGTNPMTIEVIRDEEKLKFDIAPKFDEARNSYRVGFSPLHESGNVLGMLHNSFFEMIFYIKTTVIGFVRMITGQIGRNQMSGPIGIVNIIGESFETGLKQSVMAAIANVSYLVVILSANLGALNLFPIPALDGSRLVFLFIEGIRKKPINQRIESYIHLVGFALLMLLMVFVAYNDIAKIVAG